MDSLKTHSAKLSAYDFLKNNCSNYVNNLLNSYYTYEGKTIETKFVINTINYDS